MKPIVRAAVLAVVAAAALFAATGPRDADAGAADEPVRCTCREGNACYHWLNAPVAAPADPCSCPNCRARRGSCAKIYPAEWNLACAQSSRLECFLRRHSASWKLDCSEETGKCACPGSDSASCPSCASGGKPSDPARAAKIRKQADFERKLFGAGPIVVVESPHFYVVSDLQSLKVLTQTGAKRDLGMHEIAHLYIQRAELAWQDFTRVFGDEIRTHRPIAIFLNRRKADSERIQTEYFGRANAGLVYGIRGEVSPPISGGIAEAGVAADTEQLTDDESLHQRVRTSVGHVLMSLWHNNDARPAYMPMWVFLGAGHWLGRLPAVMEDRAQFIGGEGNMISDLGNDWPKRMAKLVASGSLPHIDTFLGYTTLTQTDLAAHMRAWSWFQLFLDEDHDRFIRLLKLIRQGRNQREAFQEVYAAPPEEIDARWRARATGKLKTLADPSAGGAAPAPGPDAADGAGGLEDLAKEPDARTVSDRIKARASIDDAGDAAALVALLDRDSDLVRERVVLALSKAKAIEVREYLRGEALAKSRGRVKAGVVRILGQSKDPDAAEAVAALLADPDPDVRSQAAWAAGRLRHRPALHALEGLVADRSDDVAMAAMDAIAEFGESAEDSWPRVAPRLEDPHRPVRTAAAECLGALGSMESVEALVARMDKEQGRVRQDLHDALKRITRDDLGDDPANWAAWWKKEKDRWPNKTPPRPPEKAPDRPEDTRYAKVPTFYGVQVFSRRLAFLVDASSSMSDHTEIDPAWLASTGRTYRPGTTKYEVATAEIAATMHAVDPRTEVGIVAFRSDVKPWKDRLVTASSGAIADAVGWLGSQKPAMVQYGDVSKQKTNLVDALRIALGIKPGTSGRPTEETADEAYVMTDGQPTAGDLYDADVLLSWFREKNRAARLRLHVVTFDAVDVDTRFLRSLAEAGGGRFVAIPQTKH